MDNILEKIIGNSLENHIGLIWLAAVSVYVVIVYLRLKARHYCKIMQKTGTDLSETLKVLENWSLGLIVGDGFILYVGLLAFLPADIDGYLTVSSTGGTFLLLTGVSILIIGLFSALVMAFLHLGKYLTKKI